MPRAELTHTSIDLDYVDPRPQDRKDADEVLKKEDEERKKLNDEKWERQVEILKKAGLDVPDRPEDSRVGPVRPNWEESPLEVSSTFYLTSGIFSFRACVTVGDYESE
jgi:hypothetical protein